MKSGSEELSPTNLFASLEAENLQEREEATKRLYCELRALAENMLSNERINHTLTPTALVHEGYLRLTGLEPTESSYRTHAQFFTLAARAMRNVLIDSARRKKAEKRGGGQTVLSLKDFGVAIESRSMVGLEALDEGLNELSKQYPQLAELVELRYFAGMTMEQAARIRRISIRTAHREWQYARAWLRRFLADDENVV